MYKQVRKWIGIAFLVITALVTFLVPEGKALVILGFVILALFLLGLERLVIMILGIDLKS